MIIIILYLSGWSAIRHHDTALGAVLYKLFDVWSSGKASHKRQKARSNNVLRGLSEMRVELKRPFGLNALK